MKKTNKQKTQKNSNTVQRKSFYYRVGDGESNQRGGSVHSTNC